ncbi:hypothetical protein ONS95_007548 [Cadophora gregata]|uniref:uncharacterized protein n=1 Tax=Cadophora gregata TaxID=51156 RepID=UPI0026DBE1F2|nr:uncharacterized protein ONS95_007548 [Cadophora gregata]KAK0118666.1 hypothetical protein ONS96_011753 [Cadophora gregata f. sp. sojae]KAK0125924.1 hypothetical protein ONS95_007548 [Cadophora gregata]
MPIPHKRLAVFLKASIEQRHTHKGQQSYSHISGPARSLVQPVEHTAIFHKVAITMSHRSSRRARSSRRFSCSFSGCNSTFTRSRDARRHERNVHETEKRYCPYAGCRFRGTVRQYILRNHLNECHSSLYSTGLDDSLDISANSLPPSRLRPPAESSNSSYPFVEQLNSNFISDIYAASQQSHNETPLGDSPSVKGYGSVGYNAWTQNEVEFGSFFIDSGFEHEVLPVLRPIALPLHGHADYRLCWLSKCNVALSLDGNGLTHWDQQVRYGIHDGGNNVVM